jgi:hypothetical protein
LSFWTLTEWNIVTIVSECIEITNISLKVCLVWKKEIVSLLFIDQID